MKKNSFRILVATMLVLSMIFSVAYAVDSQPSSKVSAKVANFELIEWQGLAVNPEDPTGGSTGAWTDLFTTTIKTANAKDLFIDASFECGLWTKTLVRSKEMTADTANATSNIKVRVLVDGVEADPGEVVFAKRAQELSATLQGQLELVTDPVTGEITLEVVDFEEISLLLDTMSANSFNFVLADVASGVHEIQVQAAIDLGASVQEGQAEAKAMIGKGSVIIESVRMIKDAEVIELQ